MVVVGQITGVDTEAQKGGHLTALSPAVFDSSGACQISITHRYINFLLGRCLLTRDFVFAYSLVVL